MTLHPALADLVEVREDEPRFSDGPAALASLRAEYAGTAARWGGTAPDCPVRDDVIAGVPVRVYGAEGDPPVVYMHGGGWVIGGLDGIDKVCRTLSAAGSLRVLSVDYRLAPEHPFPAALDDVLAVVDAVGSPVAVAGDSAGGGLAASAALLRRDVVSAQLLIYPALDATLSGGSYEEFDEGFGLSRADMAAAFRMYAAGADPADPAISPLLAPDVDGAPPARIVVAANDVLRDDGRRYAERLGAELDVRAGMAHGFIRWGGVVPDSAEVMRTGAEFLAKRLRN